MYARKNPFDAVHWYIEKQRARIIAESGIANDQYHLGKLILHCLNDDPDFVLQIDGATGESENFGSVLNRSVKCALSLRNLGVRPNDHIIVAGPNHLDLTIPIYASLYLGVGVGCVDGSLNIGELEDIIKCEEPKVIFCQNEKAMDIAKALSKLKLNATIITFDKSENFSSFTEFLQNSPGQSIDGFRAADFNPEETTAFLIATSGTTGLSKAAVVTHANISISAPYWWVKYHKFPEPTRLIMLSSPIQWITAVLAIVMSPIIRITRLQSSLPLTVEHAYELINKYKPTYIKINPNMLAALMNPQTCVNCDFTSFELIMVGGSAVPQALVDEIKGYCNNEALTKQSLSDDGWFMSGDTFYRDENWNFFFVDRMKMLLKYKNHQISPVEIEFVIRKHPGVFQVAVTGVPHPTDGDLAVACIVPLSGSNVTEKEIQDMVKDTLSDSKQLRGGVIFLEELPLTVSSKINRAKLKQLALELLCNKIKQYN